MSSDILELNRALREGRSEEQREAEQQRTENLKQAAGSLFSPVGGADVLGPDVRPVYTGSLGISLDGPRQKELDFNTIPNFVLNEARIPANYAGVGLFKKGSQMINEAADAVVDNFDLMKTAFLTGPRNYIPNHYGPTDMPKKIDPETGEPMVNKQGKQIDADPTQKDIEFFENKEKYAKRFELIPKYGQRIANKLRGISNPVEAQQFRQRAADFAAWAFEGAKQGTLNILSPERRALLATTGVDPTTRQVAREALENPKGVSGRDTSKVISQGQQSFLTQGRVGFEGPSESGLDLIRRLSYLSDTVEYTPQAYGRLIKEADALGEVSEKDLKFFGEHVGNVWKGRGGVSVADAPSPTINIKSPTSRQTGNHLYDFAMKRGSPMTALKRIIGPDKNPSNVEILEGLQSSKISIHPSMGKTDAEILKNAKKNGGFYITGSYQGTAITEGGVNYVAKLTPEGKLIAVVSDENNFLENAPVIGGPLEKLMPNRVVSATPPLVFDLKSAKPRSTISGEVDIPARQEVAARDTGYKSIVEDVAGLEADPRAVTGARLQNTGAGMLLGNRSAGEEEERGR
jgi:hypothetical protein